MRHAGRKLYLVGTILALALSLCGISRAQLTQGTISGTVRDQSGAAVPGASITVKDVNTGVTRMLTTNSAGRYEAPNLPVGTYQVTAAMAGFQTVRRTGIEITVGRTAVADLLLQVGDISQTVTVVGEAAPVETTSATVSNLVNEQKVADLPLNNRDLTQLTFLQPGVLKVPNGGGTGAGFAGQGDRLTVAGARGTQNIYLLDGVSNSDLSGNPQGASGSYIGAETVKEFQIITNNYSAEYKSQAGAIISAVTKAGTNSFHGSAFEFHRNDNLDAANFFDNSFGNPKPEFKRNQFGGALGGPIRKDKTFFFASYEGLRERGTPSGTDEARVPTILARQGILPNKTVTVAPEVKPFLALYPVPGQNNSVVEDFGDGTVRIAGTQTLPVNDNFGTVKIDHSFSANHQLSGTFNVDKSDRSPFGLLGKTNGLGTTNEKETVAVGLTSVLSPTVLNEFHFGFSRTKPVDRIPLGPKISSELAFSPDAQFLGQLNTGELAPIGIRANPSFFNQKIFTFKDGVSVTRGSHSLRFGGEFNRNRFEMVGAVRALFGIWDFRTLEDFLTNIPRRFQGPLEGANDPARNYNQLSVGTYFQDNWRLTPSFTLNLGLRHEFVTVPEEDDGKVVTLMNFSDTAPTVGKFFTNETKKSFSPRIGFAWSPGNKMTSVRAGFGIFYEHPTLFQLFPTVGDQPPFVKVGRIDANTQGLVKGVKLQFPNAGFTQQDLLSGALNFRTIQFKQKNSTIYRWSFTLQRQVGTDWVLSAGYTGSRAVHLWVQSNANINKWLGFPNNPTGPKFFPAGSSKINPAFGEIRFSSPNGDSFHHDLAVGAQKRLSHGLQAQFAYTLSKTIDQGSGVSQNGDNLPEGQRGIFAFDPVLKRGLSSFDIRNSFVANFNYKFPRADLAGWGGGFLNGWQVNGIVTLTDGHPRTILDENKAQDDRIADNEGLRPDLIPGGNNNPVLGGPNLYFDPSQFTTTAVPERVGFFGNLGRNTLTSPGIATFDFSVFKEIPVREGKRFQFRAEFFNLFNRANFGDPNTSPFTTSGQRNKAAGQITNTRTSAREIQFGLRFIF